MLSDKNIEEQDIIQFVSNFQNDGFATMENVFATRLIDDAKSEAERNFSECMEIIENRKLPFGIGTKLGFKEIVQRHKSRFEMPYKMDSSIFDFVLEHPSIKKILELLFEFNDYKIINRSCVISLPEASCQSWHSDGPHISVLEYLPCHCLNLFIPLVNVDRTNGPTEFRPGSHKYTNNLAKSMLLAKARGTLRPVVVPELSIGSILMFDYRVLHRGGANISLQPRPILVFTFAKSWFKDNLNFPSRSLYCLYDVQDERDKLEAE